MLDGEKDSSNSVSSPRGNLDKFVNNPLGGGLVVQENIVHKMVLSSSRNDS